MFEVSTVEMLQDMPVGLKSFVDVARSGEKVTKSPKEPCGERRERFFFSCFGLLPLFYAALSFSTS